jgi:SET domain-containing protein
MNYYLKNTEVMGRGLYAANDIQEDKIIFTAELLVLSEQDTVTVNTTDLQYYTFKYNEKQDCLVLGDGEIFNHDDAPNTAYKLIDFDGRKVMAFYTLRPVLQHEQLFIDYNADIKVNVGQYMGKNLIG